MLRNLIIAAFWLASVIAIFVFISVTRQEPLVVVHWSNGHLMRTGSGLRLLEQMADEFNQAGHKTQSGKPIEVKVLYYGSWEQAQDLLSRVTRDVPLDRERPDPTIVTPSAAHWLLPVNQAAGRTVVDPGAAPSIARALIGIVTYRDMAECLGWPDKALGYAEEDYFQNAAHSLRTQLIRQLLLFKGRYGKKSIDGTIRLDLPISRSDMAAMFGVRLESLSRAIREMRDDGLVHFSGRTAHILDVQELFDEMESQLPS